MSKPRWEIVVVGGGPAGMAASSSAAESGSSVLLVDDNPTLGGQIWRGEEANSSLRQARKWSQRLQRSNLDILRGFRIFDHPAPGVLLAESTDSVRELTYSRLILCTGARERFLPFSGWTLPNVMGVGGLQALVKSGLPMKKKTVVVAGTGPLLWPVAAHLRRHGARVELIAEQARAGAMVRFGKALMGHPGKLAQALGFFPALAGVPRRFGCWPVAARGKDQVSSVVLQQGAKTFAVECDYLACGFHLVANLELAALLGCKTSNGAVVVDAMQQTTLEGVYCAGEPTGIGGVDLAILEGQIAGFAAAAESRKARRLLGARARQQEFSRALERTFALRPELKQIASQDTLVCRCEDVRFGRLSQCRNWREAKLYTRCGMGPCQGRICGAATEFLFGWGVESLRPPVIAARVNSLMASQVLRAGGTTAKELTQ